MTSNERTFTGSIGDLNVGDCFFVITQAFPWNVGTGTTEAFKVVSREARRVVANPIDINWSMMQPELQGSAVFYAEARGQDVVLKTTSRA